MRVERGSSKWSAAWRVAWGMAMLFALSSGSDEAEAALRVPSVFADHMVLQRQTENPIWGRSAPGEEISVTFSGVTVSTTADADGRWQTMLPPFEANATGQTLTVHGTGGSALQIHDVLIGEVWFYSGPSNIKHALQHCSYGPREVAAADYPAIRFFTVKPWLADEPQEDGVGEWTVCSPETAGDASGVAYFLSRRIHRELDVPVAALQAFLGGTRVESWTSAAAVEANPALKPVVAWWNKAIAEFDLETARQAYSEAMAQWERDVNDAEQKGENPPRKPKPVIHPAKDVDRPGRLFNGMIAPLIPYGIRGAFTYPGLGNLYWAEYAEPLIATMIGDWRQRWGRGDFPVAMIQPAPFPTDGWPKQVPDAYALLREAQIRVLKNNPNMGRAHGSSAGMGSNSGFFLFSRADRGGTIVSIVGFCAKWLARERLHPPPGSRTDPAI